MVFTLLQHLWWPYPQACLFHLFLSHLYTCRVEHLWLAGVSWHLSEETVTETPPAWLPAHGHVYFPHPLGVPFIRSAIDCGLHQNCQLQLLVKYYIHLQTIPGTDQLSASQCNFINDMYYTLLESMIIYGCCRSWWCALMDDHYNNFIAYTKNNERNLHK